MEPGIRGVIDLSVEVDVPKTVNGVTLTPSDLNPKNMVAGDFSSWVEIEPGTDLGSIFGDAVDAVDPDTPVEQLSLLIRTALSKVGSLTDFFKALNALTVLEARLAVLEDFAAESGLMGRTD